MSLNISFRIEAIDNFSRTMRDLDNTTRQAFDSVKAAGAVVTAAGAGIAAGLGTAVVKGNEFAGEMARVKAISGATESQFAALKSTALELGASTTKSAGEVASGMKEMSAMGFEVNEVIAAMPGIIAGAEASGESLARVTEVTAAALNSFGLEASQATHVADVMAMAANKSAASVDDLGYAFKYAAPVAKGLGISMEELASATAVMTDAGMAGEQAGTTLRSALLRLTDPPKEAANALESLGVNAIDKATGKMVPFSELIGQIGQSTSGMGEAAKMAALSQIFGTEAASGMLNVIAAGPEKLDALTNSFINSDGAAKKTASEGLDPFGRAMEELGGAVETASIHIRDSLAPAVTWITNLLSGAVNWFNGLNPAIQSSVGILAALTAALFLIGGPLLMVIGFIPQIVAGFTALVAGVSAAGPVIAGLMGPLTLIIGGIIAVGAALVLAYNKVSWFRDMVNAAWEVIKASFFTALTFIKGIVQAVMTEVSAFFGSQLSKIKSFWEENGSLIVKFVKSFMDATKTYIQAGMQFIKGIFQVVWPIISGLVKIAWGIIKTVISNGLDVVLGLVETAMRLLEGDWKGAWESIKGIGEDIWHNIEDFFSSIDLVEIGKDIIRGLIDGIASMGNSVKKTVGKIVDAIPAAVKNLLGIHSPIKKSSPKTKEQASLIKKLLAEKPAFKVVIA